MQEVQERMRKDLELGGYSAGTRAHYLGTIEGLVKHFGRPAESLGPDELRAHVAALATSGIGPSRLKVHLAGLKFLFAKTLGRPSDVAWMTFPRPRRSLPPVLDPSEVHALLDATPTGTHRAIAMVLYGAGLRVNEALSLEVSDIDAARGVLRVRRAKGGRERQVMLGPRLLGALREHWSTVRPQLPLLFGPTAHSAVPTAKAVRSALRRAAIVAGLRKRVTPRVLRHSFATHLLDAGTDVLVIQHVLGHASVATTMLYTRVSTRLIASAESPIERLLGD